MDSSLKCSKLYVHTLNLIFLISRPINRSKRPMPKKTEKVLIAKRDVFPVSKLEANLLFQSMCYKKSPKKGLAADPGEE